MKEQKIQKMDLIDENWVLNESNVRKLFKEMNNEDSDFKSDYSPTIYEVGGGWKVKNEEDFGGGEGGGEERWSVMSVTSPAGEVTYWEIPGFYMSHEGSSWEISETFQVNPIQVSVRQWQPVK